MKIENYSSQPYLAEINRNNKTNNLSTGNSFPNTQDSVSISAEGFALLQEMFIQGKIEESKALDSSENSGESNSSGEKEAESSSSLRDTLRSYLYDSNGKRNGEESVDDKIEKLEAQMETIASSDVSDDVKEAEIGAIQAQITTLLGQKKSEEDAARETGKSSSTKGIK